MYHNNWLCQYVFIILVLNWFYADTTHTYTHTCTMSTHLLLQFSFSLPIGLLAGQVEGGYYGVTCAYKWCGIMYIYIYTEHWRPNHVQQNATEQFKQATLSLLVAYTYPFPSPPPPPPPPYRVHYVETAYMHTTVLKV